MLREGGNALEAMISAAATIAVVYPHMNSIGGDSFWLAYAPRRAPRGIDACGAAALAASREWYAARGMTAAIPFRGGAAANTVAGTIAGWHAAFSMSRQWSGRLPLARHRRGTLHHLDFNLGPVPRGLRCIHGESSSRESDQALVPVALPEMSLNIADAGVQQLAPCQIELRNRDRGPT